MQPEVRVTAYWYAEVHGLPCDIDYLMELGAQAARLARWEGIPQQKVLEGPSWVHTWPERVFDQVLRSRSAWQAVTAAAPQQPQFYPPGSWAAAAHRPYDPLAVIPPLTHVVNIRDEPCDVRIDRPSPLGNPYRIGQDGSREQVIAAYERYLAGRPDLLALIPGLRGKRLGCWCRPLPCHGDVLARMADGPEAAIMEIYRALSPGDGITEEEARILAGAYGPDEAIPPWCPEPRGEAARDMVTGNGRYATADDYGGLPWDGDDIR